MTVLILLPTFTLIYRKNKTKTMFKSRQTVKFWVKLLTFILGQNGFNRAIKAFKVG